MRKVVKFGGSSLASAQQFEKVAEIVHAEASRRYVVPSAPGKRFRKDTKVTDMLYGCYALAEQDEELHLRFKVIYGELESDLAQLLRQAGEQGEQGEASKTFHGRQAVGRVSVTVIRFRIRSKERT